MTNKEQKIRELQELLEELYSPAVPRKFNDIKKGELRK